MYSNLFFLFFHSFVSLLLHRFLACFCSLLLLPWLCLRLLRLLCASFIFYFGNAIHAHADLEKQRRPHLCEDGKIWSERESDWINPKVNAYGCAVATFKKILFTDFVRIRSFDTMHFLFGLWFACSERRGTHSHAQTQAHAADVRWQMPITHIDAATFFDASKTVTTTKSWQCLGHRRSSIFCCFFRRFSDRMALTQSEMCDYRWEFATENI